MEGKGHPSALLLTPQDPRTPPVARPGQASPPSGAWPLHRATGVPDRAPPPPAENTLRRPAPDAAAGVAPFNEERHFDSRKRPFGEHSREGAENFKRERST